MTCHPVEIQNFLSRGNKCTILLKFSVTDVSGVTMTGSHTVSGRFPVFEEELKFQYRTTASTRSRRGGRQWCKSLDICLRWRELKAMFPFPDVQSLLDMDFPEPSRSGGASLLDMDIPPLISTSLSVDNFGSTPFDPFKSEPQRKTSLPLTSSRLTQPVMRTPETLGRIRFVE